MVCLICLSWITLLGTKSDKMRTIPQLVGLRLQVECDDSCSTVEKDDLAVAAKWLNENEVPNSCFARELGKHTDFDQTEWKRKHPDESPKTPEQIVRDHTTLPAVTQLNVMKIGKFNIFKKIYYHPMCAGENSDGSVTAKQACFDEEGYRMKAMTVAHELSHALGYMHTKNQYKGNENTVPYLVQDAVCRCWNVSNGPMKVNSDTKGFDCDHVYQ